MTGYLNAHGTYPHIEAGQFVSFPDYAWEEDEPVEVASTGTWVPLEELEVVASEEQHSEWDDLHPEVWIGWTGCHETDDATRPAQSVRDQYHDFFNRPDVFDPLEHEEFANDWGNTQSVDLRVSFSGDSQDQDIGELYEHLPHRYGRHWSFKADPKEYGYWDVAEKRFARGHRSHGRRGCLGGTKLWEHRDIRYLRQGTHRQMDDIWLLEMSGDCEDYSHMTAETYLDAHDEWMDEEAHYAELDRAFHRGQFGYFDRKGPEYVEYYVGMDTSNQRDYDLHSDDMYWDDPFAFDDDFWGSDYYANMGSDHDEPHEDVSYYDMLACEPSMEEWAAMEAAEIAREQAEEAAAEAFEARFERFPASNGIGRKTQLALAGF